VREVSREPDIATLRSGSTCDVSYIGYTTEYPGLIPSNQASYRPMSARKRLQDLSRDSAKAETLAKISSRAWSHWFSQSLLCPSPFLLSAISIFYGIDNDAYRRHRQRTGKFPHHRAYSIKLILQATATKSTRREDRAPSILARTFYSTMSDQIWKPWDQKPFVDIL
jgi:hypothetical protein